MLKSMGKIASEIVDQMVVSIGGREYSEESNRGNENSLQIEVENDNEKHLLSILNEDLWLHIFNALDIMELCRMADVCKTFKKIAVLSFSSRFKSLSYPESLHHPDEMSQMRRILCKFGHLIESLYVVDLEPRAELNAISKHSTGTLKYRDFKGNAQALFMECQKLKVLKVHFIAFTYRALPEFVQRYPNLEEIVFLVDSPETISSLLRLNLQIKKLEMISYHADKTICNASEMDNLEYLRLRAFSCAHNVLELGELKSLKVLELTDIFQAAPINAVIGAMQDYPLDCLKLSFVDSSLSRAFKMKFLKKLVLCFIDIPFDNFFKNVDEQFPSLEEMELWFSHYKKSPSLTVEGIKNLIGSSKTLSLLSIDTNQAIDYDQDAYDSLLEAVQKRYDAKILTIRISGKNAEKEPMVNNLLRMEFANNCCKSGCCKRQRKNLTNREGVICMIRMFGTHPPSCACGSGNINTGTFYQRMMKRCVSILD